MERTNTRVSSNYKPGTKRLHRPLGPLEVMYHLYHKRGIDIVAQLICLETYSHVTTNEIKEALINLMYCHPLLCMSIHEKASDGGKWFHFFEMEPHRIDLSETNEKNWENVLVNVISKPFDIENGPLWRITIVRDNEDLKGNSSKDCYGTRNDNTHKSSLTYRLAFVFGCHHSIADGIYLRNIYSDFISILDKLKNRKGDLKYEKKQSLFLPPIENILPIIYPHARGYVLPYAKEYISSQESRQAIKCLSSQLQCSSCNRRGCSHSVEALDAYQFMHRLEILRLSQIKPETTVMRFKLTDTQSKLYLFKCKSNRVTVTAASITAACMALASVLKTSLPADIEWLEVPVEIMVNLRRYVTDKSLLESYPGVAAIHIPLLVKIPLKIRHNDDAFWEIARKCAHDIYEIVTSAKPIETMIAESENELKSKPVIGKSPFVICLTNLSSVDNVVKPDLQDRYRLVAFPGMTHIAVDDMPIFYINLFTLNREFNVGVGWCSSYTSQNTASKYLWNFRQFLQSGFNKL